MTQCGVKPSRPRNRDCDDIQCYWTSSSCRTLESRSIEDLIGRQNALEEADKLDKLKRQLMTINKSLTSMIPRNWYDEPELEAVAMDDPIYPISPCRPHLFLFPT